MIRFSRREDYAVILVTKLAQYYRKRVVSISEIAKEYKISPLFLRNIAKDLRAHSIIKAVEGKNGGYTLQKNPGVLTMGEVLKAFSTEPLLQCCSSFGDDSGKAVMIHKKEEKCPKEGFCRAGYIWRKLNKDFLIKISKLSINEFINYK